MWNRRGIPVNAFVDEVSIDPPTDRCRAPVDFILVKVLARVEAKVEAACVRPLRRLAINGWRMRVVYVPAATNDGSAFMDHVVLIWTVGGHTYAVGFHDVDGIHRTLELDVALARSIELVAP